MRFIEVFPAAFSRLPASGRFVALAATAAAGAFAFTAHSTTALAGSIYFETAGGVSRFESVTSYFGPEAAGGSELGYSFNNGLFVNLSPARQLIQVHFGAQLRLSSAASGSLNVGYLALYPEMRIQLACLYVGVGATPLIMARAQPTNGILNYAFSSSTVGLLGEAGILWPLARDLSLGLSTSAQSISRGGGAGPTLDMDGTFFMRFYFGFFHSSEEGSGDYKGWRYPFGMLR